MAATILYLDARESNPIHAMQLAGMRRFAVTRGWDAVAVSREALASPGSLKRIVRELRAVGCIVEGSAAMVRLPPSLFAGIPVVYLHIAPASRRPVYLVTADAEAIAFTAFRELSAGMPHTYATVEFRRPLEWTRLRAEAFRRIVEEKTDRPCFAFTYLRGECAEDYVARLHDFVAKLPRGCAIFAANDVTAALVAKAASALARPVPRDLAILGVDNLADVCETAATPLSSIQLDWERVGFVAARALGDECAARLEKQGRYSQTFHDDISIGPLVIVRRKSTSGRGRHEKRILEAVGMIRREACDGLTAAALAARFPGSRHFFEMRFREATGHSVLDEILHVRMESVLAYLSCKEVSLGAIADFCGFPSQQALRKFFRERYRCSMRQWRKRNVL